MVSFRQASALALPFEAEEFDAATLIHVGMNIKDKAKVFSEVRRVLKDLWARRAKRDRLVRREPKDLPVRKVSPVPRGRLVRRDR